MDIGYTIGKVPEKIQYRFFGRQGGVSNSPYNSLNLRPTLVNEKQALQANFQIVAQAIGVQPQYLFFPHQVHGTQVVTIMDQAFFSQPGIDQFYQNQQAFLDGDASVTNVAGVALGIITADCAPVLMYDSAHQVVAAVHCGWRSALNGVLANTVQAMETLAAQTSEIEAIIGPCIAQASYEVDATYRQQFLQHNQAFEQFFLAGRQVDKYQFSLRDFCQFQLKQLGITKIAHLDYDTFTEADKFYSFRRDGEQAGRQASVIMLKE